jgi:hypothetical protein
MQRTIFHIGRAGHMMQTWVKAFLLSVFIGGTVTAADLNAPAGKSLTIGSELARGHNVTADCISKTQYWDDLTDCVSAAEQVENRNNTDSDAFQLGLYAAALVKLTELEADSLTKGHTVGRLMIITGKQWYLSVAELQGSLGVSDQQLSQFADAFPAKLKAFKKHWAEHATP